MRNPESASVKSEADGLLSGFAPVSQVDANILILGSMPGKKSLELQQYYGHARNLFWPIIAEIFEFDKHLDYVSRCQKLIEHQLAVWDVLKHCERPGSLDSAIKKDSMIINDFERFFQDHPKVQKVLFNGKTAEKLFLRFVQPGLKHLKLIYQGLPSTSPANASMPREVKQKLWKKAFMQTSAVHRYSYDFQT